MGVIALGVDQARPLEQADELVGAKRHRGRRGDVVTADVEGLAGAGVADRRQHDDGLIVETLLNRLGIDAARLARVLVVHAVDHADRLGDDEVARRHAEPRAGHRRVRKPHRKKRLELDAIGARPPLSHTAAPRRR